MSSGPVYPKAKRKGFSYQFGGSKTQFSRENCSMGGSPYTNCTSCVQREFGKLVTEVLKSHKTTQPRKGIYIFLNKDVQLWHFDPPWVCIGLYFTSPRLIRFLTRRQLLHVIASAQKFWFSVASEHFHL